MGTEVVLSITTLRSQLESERSSLYKIDESIKKIVQTPRFQNDRFNASGDFGKNAVRLGNRNSFSEAGNNIIKNDELFGKRRHETKTVFSRLSARAEESDGEEERGVPKRSRISSTVSRELPSRAEVLKAQGGDEASRGRNRRMFGSLLGTLQKFKQEEIVLQTKEDKKAQVERKVEEQERQKKELARKERKILFAEREQKKDKIKSLEVKVARLSEFERWESSQRTLGNFILTKTTPPVYWLPKRMDPKAEELLAVSRTRHEELMQSKRQSLQEYLERIEQQCLRKQRGHNQPGTEGDVTDHAHGDVTMEDHGDVTMEDHGDVTMEDHGDVTMEEHGDVTHEGDHVGVNGDNSTKVEEMERREVVLPEQVEVSPSTDHVPQEPNPETPTPDPTTHT